MHLVDGYLRKKQKATQIRLFSIGIRMIIMEFLCYIFPRFDVVPMKAMCEVTQNETIFYRSMRRLKSLSSTILNTDYVRIGSSTGINKGIHTFKFKVHYGTVRIGFTTDMKYMKHAHQQRYQRTRLIQTARERRIYFVLRDRRPSWIAEGSTITMTLDCSMTDVCWKLAFQIECGTEIIERGTLDIERDRTYYLMLESAQQHDKVELLESSHVWG